MSLSKFSPLGFRPDIAQGLDKFSLAADQAGFVGLQIAPVFEVGMQNGEYTVREVEDILQIRDDNRGSDGAYNRAKLRFTKDNYATSEHGFEVPVDRRMAAIHKGWFDADLSAAAAARDVVLRNHNARVISTALAVSGQNTAASAVWTTKSTDVVSDVRAARIAQMKATGVRPNALCVDWEVHEALIDNDSVRSRCLNLGLVRDSTVPMLTKQILAVAFDVDYYIVSGSFTNSANQPNAASIASMWDRTKALLFTRYDGQDLGRPHFMRTFHWGEDSGNIGETFDRYYSNEVRGDVVRQRMDTAEKLVYSKACRIITGVAA